MTSEDMRQRGQKVNKNKLQLSISDHNFYTNQNKNFFFAFQFQSDLGGVGLHLFEYSVITSYNHNYRLSACDLHYSRLFDHFVVVLMQYEKKITWFWC